MDCKYVIHAVGPIWKDGKSAEHSLLAEAVRNSLKAAESKNCRSVSIPAISSGIFGFPKDQCAKVLFDEVERYFDSQGKIKDVRFTNFDEETTGIMCKEFKKRY